MMTTLGVGSRMLSRSASPSLRFFELSVPTRLGRQRPFWSCSSYRSIPGSTAGIETAYSWVLGWSVPSIIPNLVIAHHVGLAGSDRVTSAAEQVVASVFTAARKNPPYRNFPDWMKCYRDGWMMAL